MQRFRITCEVPRNVPHHELSGVVAGSEGDGIGIKAVRNVEHVVKLLARFQAVDALRVLRPAYDARREQKISRCSGRPGPDLDMEKAPPRLSPAGPA